jgi:hypothetical protein
VPAGWIVLQEAAGIIRLIKKVNTIPGGYELVLEK